MTKAAVEGDQTQSQDLVRLTHVENNKAVVMLCLNRPSRANAYTSAMLDALEREMRAFMEGGVVRVIVIRGEGDRSFCAGADKDELKGRRAEDGLNLRSRELFDMWAALPILTVAAINGAAIGGGLELALACDIRLCSTTARFSFPELTLGLSPAAGGMERLPVLVGKGRAKEMILFGRELDAATALDWGLVSYVGEDFEAKALELAERAGTQDPLAVRLSKRVIDSDPALGKQDLTAFAQALLYERKFLRGEI